MFSANINNQILCISMYIDVQIRQHSGGRGREGITPSGESEGVWGQEEAGTELDQRPMRTCKYSELTFKHK